MLVEWYRGVFGWHTPWKKVENVSSLAISEPAMLMLRALMGQAASMQLDVDDLDPGHLAQLRQAVDRAVDLVKAADRDELDAVTRRYLLGLLTAAQQTLDEIDIYGTATLRSVVFELGGAFEVVAEHVKDESAATKWRQAARDLLIQVVSGVAVVLASAVAQQALPPGH